MEKKEKYTEISLAAPAGWGTRHTIALLCFFGSAVSYAIRFNLSLAIVDMVNSTIPANTSTHIHSPHNLNVTYAIPCPNLIEGGEPSNFFLTQDFDDSYTSNNSSGRLSASGEFNWSEAEQGIILGSFFWGYIVTQLPGGMLCKRYGGKWPFGVGLLVAGIFTILTPFAARTDKKYLIFARIIEGLASGLHISAQTTIISSWAPPNERSLISTIAFSGTFVGTAVTMIVSGYLIHGNVMGGWPSVFYCVGLFSICWFVVWALVVSNTPADHKWISAEEKNYIEKSLGLHDSRRRGEKIRTPWKKVLTCVPLWATFIAHFAHAWGIYTLLTEMPTYMKTVLHFNIKKNSWLSAVPYLTSGVVGILFAQSGDVLLRRNVVKIVTVRKTAQIIAHGGSALALIGCAYSGCDQVLTVFFLIVSVALSGCSNSGFIVSYVDLAPKHAGILVGAANTFANLSGIGAPFVAGLLINNNPSVENWKYVFLISAGILLVGCVVYAAFASGEEQPWNDFKKLSESEDVPEIVNGLHSNNQWSNGRSRTKSHEVYDSDDEDKDRENDDDDEYFDHPYEINKREENAMKAPLKGGGGT